MTTIDNVDFSIGHISPVRFRLRRVKRRLVLAPNHQHARPLFAHPSLPPWIVFDVGAVVVEEVALNLDLAGLIKKRKFIRPQIGVIAPCSQYNFCSLFCEKLRSAFSNATAGSSDYYNLAFDI